LQVLEDSTPTTGNYVVMGTVVVSPKSVGSVTLATASAWDYPIIDTKFMSTASDKYIMGAGIILSFSFFGVMSH
jgi:hypothetical protein